MRRLAQVLIVLGGCGEPAPPTTTDAPPAIAAQRIPLVGCGFQYTGSFAIGAGSFRLIIDTGSNALGVAAVGCAQCTAAGVAPPLYTASSTTTDLGPGAFGMYGDNTSWHGEFVEDEVAAGALPAVELAFGAIATEMGFFEASACGSPQGILGMSPPADPMYPTSLPHELAAAGATDAFAMRYCLGDGELWLGGYDPAALAGDPQWTPMAQGQFYEVAVTDVAVGGTSIGVAAASYGQAIVDSGNDNLGLPTAAFDAVSSAVAASPAFASRFGGASWLAGTQCTQLADTRAQIDAALPALTIEVGSIAAALPATSSYLIAFPTAGGTTYCPGLYATSITNLGNTLARAGVTIYDRANNRLGIAPAATPCDDADALQVNSRNIHRSIRETFGP